MWQKGERNATSQSIPYIQQNTPKIMLYFLKSKWCLTRMIASSTMRGKIRNNWFAGFIASHLYTRSNDEANKGRSRIKTWAFITPLHNYHCKHSVVRPRKTLLWSKQMWPALESVRPAWAVFILTPTNAWGEGTITLILVRFKYVLS